MYLESTTSEVTLVPAARVVGRYLMYDQIAAGGMASVHFGRLLGAVGFARIVAIKRLHSHCVDDGEFVSMFVDEVRVAARIQHPNVASPLDVVLDKGEIFLVMEYIQGDTLAHLLSSARARHLAIPPAVTAAIISGALRGLHAAHEAVDENRQPLNIIHRDVSPQNVMVGVDGVGRVLDFGVAKSMYHLQSTQQGHLKGKLCYMAPEQMQSGAVDRRVDIFAAGIVLWETLTQQRLFMFDDLATGLSMVMNSPIPRPGELKSQVPPALEAVVMKALDRDVHARFQSAREFADAIEAAIILATPSAVGEWVERLCGDLLSKRSEIVANIERSTFDLSSTQSGRDLLLWQQGPVTPPPVVVSRPFVAPPPVVEMATVREAGPQAPLPMPAVPLDAGDIAPPTLSQVLTRGRRWVRRVLPALVGVALVSVLVHLVGIQMAIRSVRNPDPPTPTPSASPLVAPPIPQAACGPASTQTFTQSLSAPDSAKPSVLGSASTRKRVVAPSGAKRRSQPPSKGSEVDRPSVSTDCATPFTIDARGIRRIKPHCR